MEYFNDIFMVSAEADIPIPPDVIVNQRFSRIYSVHLVTEGDFFLEIDGVHRVTTSAPILFWHCPDHHYRYGRPSNSRRRMPWYHCYAAFTGSRGQQLIESGFSQLSKNGYVNVLHTSGLQRFFKNLSSLMRRNPVMTKPEMMVHLEEILIAANRQVSLTSSTELHLEAIEALGQEIRMYPQWDWDFHSEAQKACLSYSRFRHLFRKIVGTSPHDYVIQCRLQAAMEFLEETVLPIKSIAEKVGFADQAYFNRLFKRQIGVTPGAFRKLSLKRGQ